MLARIAGPGGAVVSNPGYVIVGAWIREADGLSEGEMIASYPGVRPDPTTTGRSGPSRTARSRATVGGNKVTIYTGDLGKARRRASRLRAYVALVRNPQAPKTGGGGNLGIVLAILGPLVVGGIAYGIAERAHEERPLPGPRDRPPRLVRRRDARRCAPRAATRPWSRARWSAWSATSSSAASTATPTSSEIAEKERKVAEEIHSALISKNPPRLSNYEVETLYKPGFEIAGDHFEYFPIDEHHLGVILLDTNVRGLPAALVMASARSYVRAAAPGELSPGRRCSRRSTATSPATCPPGRHVTALYVVIDTREGKATIASAGHLPLIVYRHASGKVAKVNPEGIALGLDHGPVFERALQEGDIPIGVGDRIVLYTDGALNISNEYGEEFGESRFYEAVAREAPKNSQAFVNFVGSAIDQFHLNAHAERRHHHLDREAAEVGRSRRGATRPIPATRP